MFLKEDTPSLKKLKTFECVKTIILLNVGDDNKAHIYKRQRSRVSSSDKSDNLVKRQTSRQVSITEKGISKEKEVKLQKSINQTK